MAVAPLLATRRFELWQPQAGDLADLYALIAAEETRRFLGTFTPSESDSFARLLRNAGSWALWGYGVFSVRRPGDPAIVASCGVFRSHRGFGADKGLDNVAEAGWILRPDLWGQGAATELMQAVLAWFDTTHGRQRVAAMIEQGHAASAAVAAKLDFVRYGTHTAEDGIVLDLYERV